MHHLVALRFIMLTAICCCPNIHFKTQFLTHTKVWLKKGVCAHPTYSSRAKFWVDFLHGWNRQQLWSIYISLEAFILTAFPISSRLQERSVLWAYLAFCLCNAVLCTGQIYKKSLLVRMHASRDSGFTGFQLVYGCACMCLSVCNCQCHAVTSPNVVQYIFSSASKR